MFSARTAWPREQNALARELGQRTGSGRPILDLTLSNPTQAGLEQDGRAILAALGHAGALRYQPEPLGPPAARHAIAEYYARRGLLVSPEDVVCVATTSEAYSFLFRLLVNPGESVAVPRPSYPLFSFLADLCDVELSPYHLLYRPGRGYELDFENLEEVFEPGSTRAVINVVPNNPTGSASRPAERQRLSRFAAHREAALISDEVFLDYLIDPGERQRRSFVQVEECLTFTLSGLSKVAGLPQLKLSWLVISGPADLKAEARARLEIIADTMLSLSTVVARALPELLALAEPFQERLNARLAANRAALAALIQGTGVGLRPNDGGWYAMLDLPEGRDDEAWAIHLLKDHGLAVHPGYLFDVVEPSVVVLSLLAEEAPFREGVERLLQAAATG